MSVDNRYLPTGIAVSLAVHSLVAFLVPGPALPVSDSPNEELVEVALMPLDYGELGYGSAASGASLEEMKLLEKLDASTVTFAKQLPLGVFVREPRSSGDDELKVDPTDVPDKRLPEMVERALQRLAESRRDLGTTGQSESRPWSIPSAEPPRETHIPKTVMPAANAPEETRRPVNIEKIVGPVSSRRIVYRPEQSDVNITTPGSVKIKFWVEPDGTVSRMLFEQKLDANLDDYSARYVRELRFEALSEGKDYVEWGTITIAFRGE